jgi:hypothetical protein
VADTVRVGLDRFVLDALGSEALEERALCRVDWNRSS